MTSAALAILETVSEGPGGIEEAVGYNRQELLHLALDDKARTNYVYWPYLRRAATGVHVSPTENSYAPVTQHGIKRQGLPDHYPGDAA